MSLSHTHGTSLELTEHRVQMSTKEIAVKYQALIRALALCIVSSHFFLQATKPWVKYCTVHWLYGYF